jgi:hypothetical protein
MRQESELNQRIRGDSSIEAVQERERMLREFKAYPGSKRFFQDQALMGQESVRRFGKRM